MKTLHENYVLDEIKLESIRFFTERCIERRHLGLGYKNDIEVLKGEFDNLICVLESKIWGERLETKVIKHPLNWWEALKEQFAPDFFLKKYPVIFKTYDIDAKILYPNLKIQMPNEEHVVYMQVYDSIWKD